MNRFFSHSHQPKILGLVNPTTKMLQFFPVCQLVGKSEERINFTLKSCTAYASAACFKERL